jgi:hypothetical protein
MTNLKTVAAATIIVASLSVSAYALSQSSAASHAEDAPTDAPTTQVYTAPDVTVPASRDAATATTPTPAVQAPSYQPMPAHVDGNSPITATDRTSITTDKPFIGAPLPMQLPNLVLPPCAQEDSVNCYWDTRVMGNGTGESFINWNGVLYYAG